MSPPSYDDSGITVLQNQSFASRGKYPKSLVILENDKSVPILK